MAAGGRRRRRLQLYPMAAAGSWLAASVAGDVVVFEQASEQGRQGSLGFGRAELRARAHHKCKKDKTHWLSIDCHVTVGTY